MQDMHRAHPYIGGPRCCLLISSEQAPMCGCARCMSCMLLPLLRIVFPHLCVSVFYRLSTRESIRPLAHLLGAGSVSRARRPRHRNQNLHTHTFPRNRLLAHSRYSRLPCVLSDFWRGLLVRACMAGRLAQLAWVGGVDGHACMHACMHARTLAHTHTHTHTHAHTHTHTHARAHAHAHLDVSMYGSDGWTATQRM